MIPIILMREEIFMLFSTGKFETRVFIFYSVLRGKLEGVCPSKNLFPFLFREKD